MKKESVLITGSSKGLGKELALTFAREGYNLIIHGRDKTSLNDSQREILKYGSKVEVVYGDLRSEKTIKDLANIAEKKDLSILVNNAGVFCPGLPLDKISRETVDELLETNLYAPIKLSKEIYPLFLKKNSGTIININSIMGLESKKFRSVASACKYGLKGFTDSLNLEAIENGIHVMGVYPTRIRTRPGRENSMDPKYVSEEIFAAYKEKKSELILDGRKHSKQRHKSI